MSNVNHKSEFVHDDGAGFEMRLARESDADALAEVHFQSIKETFASLIPEYVNSRSIVDFRDLWRQRVHSTSSMTCALLRGADLVGFVSAGNCRDEDVDEECGCVDRIYLHPSVWEKRLGGRLLQWCENNLKERRFETVKLWVFQANERAIRFYERKGYVPDGKTKVEFDSVLIRYTKSLAAVEVPFDFVEKI